MTAARLTIGAACLALVFTGRAFAALDVKSPVALITDICDQCADPSRVELPLTVTGVDPKDLRVAVVDVALGNRHDQEFRQAIEPAVATSASGSPLLRVIVKQGLLRAPGTYQIALEFSAEGEKPVSATLQLVRNPASLQPLGTIIVDRILKWPSQPDVEPSKPDLKLIEMSNRTSLTGIRIHPPNPLTGYYLSFEPPGPCASNASSSVGAVAQVPAGSERCVPYAFKGDFPLGSRSQTYSILAAELSAAVPVTFEIRSRLSAVYVVVFAVLGVLFSLLLKVQLQRQIEVGEARALSLDLLEKVDVDRQTHKDSTFLAAVSRPFDALRSAVDGSDVAAMTLVRSELDKAWRDALSDLARRRMAAQQQLDRLRSVAETPWQIPSELLQLITQLRADTERARELLDSGLVTHADAALQAATSRVVVGLSPAITQWQETVSDLLELTLGSHVGLSPAVVGAVADAASAARTTVGTTHLRELASIDELLQALTGVSEERRAARKVARMLSIALNQEIDGAAAALGKSRDGFPDVVKAVSALTTTLLDSVDRPPADSSAIRQALEGISTAWRTALEVELGSPLPAPMAELVKQQRFVDAATGIAAAMRGESDAVSSRRLALALRPAVVSDDPAVAVAMFSTELAQVARPVPLQALLARTRAQIAAAKLWQTVFVALLAMIVGYGLFAPKFVGDYQDFVMIFFWAFGLDLTADSVAKLAPTTRK